MRLVVPNHHVLVDLADYLVNEGKTHVGRFDAGETGADAELERHLLSLDRRNRGDEANFREIANAEADGGDECDIVRRRKV